MTDNFYKSEIDRELLLNIEIQKQNLKALPEKFKAQKKVVSPVTQQMIDDYKKQFRDLYKRKDAKGTEQFFKFLIPDALPTLEKLDKGKFLREGKLKIVLDEDEINEVNNQINIFLDLYNKNENINIPELYNEIEEYKKDINELNADRAELLENKKSLVSFVEMEEYGPLIKKDIIDIDKQIDDYVKLIKETNDDINDLVNQNKNYMSDINALKKSIELNEEHKISNEKYLYTVEQNNRKKLDEYAETLKRMNDGQIDVTRGQFESEVDYLKRLGDVALIQEDLTVIHLFNNNEFKKNLKTILQSEWKIENISKAFTDDDKFLLNKTFAGFKKYFKDTIGLGNKNLEVDEYVALIIAYLDSADLSKITKASDEKDDTSSNQDSLNDDIKDEFLDESEIPPPPKFPPPPPSRLPPPPPSRLPPVFESSVIDTLQPEEQQESSSDDKYYVIGRFETNTLVIINKENTNTLYIRITEETDTKKSLIEISNNGNNFIDLKDVFTDTKTFQSKIKLILLDIFNEDDLNLFIKDVRDFGGLSEKTAITEKHFIKYIREILTNPKNTDDEINEALMITGSGLRKSKKNKKSKRKKIIPQKGASIKQVDKFVEFGNLILLLRKLYDTNVLSIKDKTGINIPGIPNQKTGDNFVQLILKIVNNEDINLKDIDDLNEKDTILFTVLMNKSGLKKKYKINNTRALEALTKRLELIEGEIEAGNDNTIVLKELYEIVFKLAYLGAITLSNAKKHYKQTVELLKNN